jgi:kynurenine formamidase
MKQVIDLTWGLFEGMPNHPAHPVAPKLLSGTMTHKGTAIWMAKSTAYGQVSFASEQFLLAAHLGTHLDAPYHANPDGPTVESVDLSYTCGDACWLDVSAAFGPRALVTPEHLERALEAAGAELAPITLLFTGWSRTRDEPRRYFRDSMGLSEAAAIWLRERGVLTVGVDAPSVDPGGSAECPAHMTFFRPRPGERYICVVENLVRVETIPRPAFYFVGAPLPLKGVSGSPIRALALVDA